MGLFGSRAELPGVVFRSLEEKKTRALKENADTLWERCEVHFKKNKKVGAAARLLHGLRAGDVATSLRCASAQSFETQTEAKLKDYQEMLKFGVRAVATHSLSLLRHL